MCGIFGAIGTYNRGIVRALAIANRARGQESLGLFDSTGEFIKAAGDPLTLLGKPKFSQFIGEAGWFLAGHTRFATFGAVKNKNAHPFRYGNIIGSHNGCVDVPRGSKYRVDSQYLFDRLHQSGGDYQAALADISGYWGLAWFDGTSFYLQAHANTVTIGHMRGAWYYSSDVKHLLAAAGPLENVFTLADGSTIRFDEGAAGYTVLPRFTSSANEWVRIPTKWQPAKATWPASPRGDAIDRLADRVYAKLDHDMHDYADGLAQEAGYGGLVDFMADMGMKDYRRAIECLEDNGHRGTFDALDYDGDDLWAIADDSDIRLAV